MKDETTRNEAESGHVLAEILLLKQTAEQQQRELRDLLARNAATFQENIELRAAVHADSIEIDELRNARLQIESLNRNLRSHNCALEALNQELESFSYAVSHDLRSPLRSIQGFSEALRESALPKLSEEEAAWLRRISDAAVRMDRLTEDLLRLSRITRSQLRRTTVDLAGMARDVVQELRYTDPTRNVVFAIADRLEAVADPALTRVVLSNLLGNAWKYTGKCQQALISFGQQCSEDQKTFFVRDNGAGFDMAYSAKLFTPFQRLHSSREFPGSGVGLACVARVIHKHGGRIWADARTGEGAAFFFTIPDLPEAEEVRALD